MASSRAVGNSTLVFRILVLILLAASIAVMATNNIKRSDITFKDLKTYRYVIATAIIGCIYTLIQIPFSIYNLCTEKSSTCTGCVLAYEFYADKAIAFLLATGVGAGVAVTYEYKQILDTIFALIQRVEGAQGIDEAKSDRNEFLNRGYLATGILFLGFLCMAVLSVLSSVTRNTSSSRGFFG